MDQKTIKEYIRALEHMTAFMRGMLDEHLQMPSLNENAHDALTEFTELRMLAKSSAWPNAVPQDMICGDDDDSKFSRAAGIVHDFIKTDLTNKSFLDFGCGEGHIPHLIANLLGSKKVCGFDINPQHWDKLKPLPNLTLTTNYNDIKNLGPFDVILLNDVIDHAEDPLNVLEQVREVKEPQTGKIFMRCHPWTSRTGTHLYKELNRAYLHLAFEEKELLNVMGLRGLFTNKIIDPLPTYRNAIKNAGFTILQEDIIRHPVELFFTTKNFILRRIQENFAKKDPKFATEFPRDILEIQFVDYVLI